MAYEMFNNPLTVLGAAMMQGFDPQRQGLGGLGTGMLAAGQQAMAQENLEFERARAAEEQERVRQLTNMQMQQYQAKLAQQQRQQEAVGGFVEGLPEDQQAIAAAFPEILARQRAESLYPDPVAPGAVVTNLIGGQEPHPGTKQMWEQTGKNIESRISDYRQRAQQATDFQTSLNRFSNAMERAGKTGGQEELKKTIREYASTFGIPVDEAALASAQGVDQAAKMMVADQLRLNAGPQTDFDAQFASQYLPGLKTSTEANKEAIRYSSSVNKLRQIQGSLANKAYSAIEGQAPDLGVVQGRLDVIDQSAMGAPAVIPAGDGWVSFDDYHKESKRRGRSDNEILNSWMEVATQVRGVN